MQSSGMEHLVLLHTEAYSHRVWRGSKKPFQATTSNLARSCRQRGTGIWLYHQQLPRSSIGIKHVLPAMKDWYIFKPELIKKQPFYLSGCGI